MRKTPITPGEYYHIYNRGAGKGIIFFIPEHWRYFLRQMKNYFLPEYAEIIAYCLMPNHYHMMIYVKHEDFGNNVMMPLALSYTKSINHEMGRTGHLFQGPYQAKHIETTSQLIHLSRYIHLNPVKAGFVDKPEDWIYSSYREFVGLRDGMLPNPNIVLSDFLDGQDYRNYVETPQEDEKLGSILFTES
jgi:REP element-mobilizing transposase RayT